jgi:hypothetical protein
VALQALEGSSGLFAIGFKNIDEFFNVNESVWKTAENLVEKEVVCRL